MSNTREKLHLKEERAQTEETEPLLIQETPLSPEQLRLERLRHACQKIEQEAAQVLREKYPSSEFPFHNLEHSRQVADDAAAILRLIQEIDPALVSDEDIIFVQAEAMRHDIPQDREQYGTQDYSPNSNSITRLRGFNPDFIDTEPEIGNKQVGNEQQAAKLLLEEMANGPDSEIFQPFDRVDVYMDIGSTYPDVFLNSLPDSIASEHLRGQTVFTMTQPYAREAGVRGMALAFADLKEPGGRITNQERPHDRAFKAGNDEYRELYRGHTLQIREILDTGTKIEEIPTIEKHRLVKSMLSWKRTQEGFYLGQQHDFEQILKLNPAINGSEHADEIRDALRKRYDGFQTIAAGLRQEYLSLTEDIGFVTEGGEPLLDLIAEEERECIIISANISTFYEKEDENILTSEEQTEMTRLHDAYEEKMKLLEDHKIAFDQKLATLSPANFMRVVRAMGYE